MENKGAHRNINIIIIVINDIEKIIPALEDTNRQTYNDFSVTIFCNIYDLFDISNLVKGYSNKNVREAKVIACHPNKIVSHLRKITAKYFLCYNFDSKLEPDFLANAQNLIEDKNNKDINCIIGNIVLQDKTCAKYFSLVRENPNSLPMIYAGADSTIVPVSALFKNELIHSNKFIAPIISWYAKDGFIEKYNIKIDTSSNFNYRNKTLRENINHKSMFGAHRTVRVTNSYIRLLIKQIHNHPFLLSYFITKFPPPLSRPPEKPLIYKTKFTREVVRIINKITFLKNRCRNTIK